MSHRIRVSRPLGNCDDFMVTLMLCKRVPGHLLMMAGACRASGCVHMVGAGLGLVAVAIVARQA